MVSRVLIIIGLLAISITFVWLIFHKPSIPGPMPGPMPDLPSCDDSVKEDTNPKIVAFKKYLVKNLQTAVNKTAKSFKYTPDVQIGLSIYMKNTPLGRGPIRAWAQTCGDSSYCDRPQQEPNFYFGSGTKPLTATLVASKLYKLWRATYPSQPASAFIDWYAGKKNSSGIRGGHDAVTYKDLFKLTKGFANSQFTESLSVKSNTQAADSSDKTYTQTLQEWLFCCPEGGMIPKCPAGSSLFCSNSCDTICPIPLDFTTYSDKCSSPLCPDDLCSWTWCQTKGLYTSGRDNTTYDKPVCTGAALSEKDPNAQKWVVGEWCACAKVMPKDYSNILNNLSVYNVAMMRSGIPDSDSIWAVDNAAQLASRTHPIGPIQFVAEILGFDWDPLWNSNGNPIVSSMDITTNGYIENTTNPVAMYSSSAYSFLGVLLWLLTDSSGQRDWSTIDLNSMLPKDLYCLLNFAGTEGRYNKKYFTTDAYGNKYYSYEQTISKGDVVHSPDLVDKDGVSTSIIGHNQTTLERIKESFITETTLRRRKARAVSAAGQQGDSDLKTSPVNRREMRTATGTKVVDFVDWDASSGLMDGNSWGPCSGMAEMYMNIFSPTAENPIMPKEIQAAYVEEFLRYEGSNWKALYNNQLRAPYCLGGQAWGQGSTYNCGAMGPDWIGIYDTDSNQKYGVIPCYGHLGETYGSCSGHVYFPGGKLTPYPPYKNDSSSYSPKNWSLIFEFAGGLEFTVSQAVTDCQDQSTAIQNFIFEVVKNPFRW